MEKQIGFAENEHAGKKKRTRREIFLGQMEGLIPWARLVGIFEPHYPTGARGRPPIGIERMLRIYFMQQWYGLGDEALEDAMYDRMEKIVIPIHFTAGGRSDFVGEIGFSRLAWPPIVAGAGCGERGGVAGATG